VVDVVRPAGVAELIEPDRGWHYVILSYFVRAAGGREVAGDDAAALRWAVREDLEHLELTPGLARYLEDFGTWN
jgi:ADP-ribose pyrophosphatase YjhB (NUDIX family)